MKITKIAFLIRIRGFWACVFSEYIFCDKKIKFRKSLFYGSYMTISVCLWVFLKFFFLVTFFSWQQHELSKTPHFTKNMTQICPKSSHFRVSVYSAYTSNVRRFICFTFPPRTTPETCETCGCWEIFAWKIFPGSIRLVTRCIPPRFSGFAYIWTFVFDNEQWASEWGQFSSTTTCSTCMGSWRV